MVRFIVDHSMNENIRIQDIQSHSRRQELYTRYFSLPLRESRERCMCVCVCTMYCVCCTCRQVHFASYTLNKSSPPSLLSFLPFSLFLSVSLSLPYFFRFFFVFFSFSRHLGRYKCVLFVSNLCDRDSIKQLFKASRFVSFKQSMFND